MYKSLSVSVYVFFFSCYGDNAGMYITDDIQKHALREMARTKHIRIDYDRAFEDDGRPRGPRALRSLHGEPGVVNYLSFRLSSYKDTRGLKISVSFSCVKDP